MQVTDERAEILLLQESSARGRLSRGGNVARADVNVNDVNVNADVIRMM